MSRVALPEVREVAREALERLAPPGVVRDWSVEETIDWEGSPSVTLRLIVDDQRWRELTAPLKYAMSEMLRRRLQDAEDDRVIHINLSGAGLLAAE